VSKHCSTVIMIRKQESGNETCKLERYTHREKDKMMMMNIEFPVKAQG